MLGEHAEVQEALFYEFSLERHIPADHLLWAIDRFIDLSGIRTHLKPFCCETGWPSIDPELMIRMLLIGYCFGIRSERWLCEEVHLNLAYRWFCRLGLVRHSLASSHEGGHDLQGDGQHPRHPDLLGHSKIENTVRYLGVDVEDALLLAERTEI